MMRRDRRRRRAALLVSLLVHTALLAPLLWVAPRLRTDQAPSPAHIRLGLVPAADLGLATRQGAPGQAASRQPTPAPRPALAARPPVAPSLAATALPASAPHAAPSAAVSSPAGQGAASAAGADAASQAAIGRALRAAFACAPGQMQNLDEEARDACRKRLRDAAAAMGEAKVDTIPPLKRAYFDAVQKAYEDIRHYPTPDSTLTRLPGAASMYDQKVMTMPGRAPMAGCGLKFGGPKGAKPAGAPPHGLYLKLGPVICGVTPPQGVLTEESVTPNADDAP